jgi:hypothetical protein
LSAGAKDAGAGQLAAGVVMLGKGTNKELLEKAREEGVELLLMFDVNAKRTSSGKETADTKMRLVDPIGGKDLFTSKKLNNIQVYDAREKPGFKGPDPIDDVVDLLFKSIDEKNYKLGDFPATLTAEHVKNRYDKLLTEEHDNPLPVLVELRHYYRMKLLPGKLMFEGYKKLLGDEKAEQLAKGKIEEKREALAEWLPDGLQIASASAAAATPGATGNAGAGGYAPPGAVPPGVAPPGVAPGGYVPPGAPSGVAAPGATPSGAGAGGYTPPTDVGAPGAAPLPGSPTGVGGPAAPGGAAAKKFEIPGTPLSIPVPTGFTLGSDASGPVMSSGTAAIRAKRDERPMKTALVDYSKENLARGGFTLTESKEVDALGHKITLVQAVHNDSKYKFIFALLPDTEASVIIVSASFTPEDEVKLAPAIMSAVLSMQAGQ